PPPPVPPPLSLHDALPISLPRASSLPCICCACTFGSATNSAARTANVAKKVFIGRLLWFRAAAIRWLSFGNRFQRAPVPACAGRSEEHTSELQSPDHLV